MSTEQILLTIIGAMASIWAVFKVLLPRLVDAKLQAEEYERVRMAFREDKTFEMLEDTLEHWKSSHAEERKETIATWNLQTELIQSINNIAASVDKQTNTIRILVQQVAGFDERLSNIETRIGSKDDTDRPER